MWGPWNITIWDIIKGFAMLPFRLVHRLVKVYWPKHHRDDTRLMNDLYSMLEELQQFAIYMKKGPVHLERYKISNVAWETHMQLRYISDEWDEQRRIGFIIKRDEDRFSFFHGANSSNLSSSYDKDRPFHELYARIMEEAYRCIEMSNVKAITRAQNYYNDYWRWRETVIDPIKAKYGVEDFKPIHYALMMSANEPTSHLYIRGREVLLRFFDNDEARVDAWVDEIDGAYTAKVMADKLM